MTTVTKIFVVLVCLFAFIFTPLVVAFVARTHNWKKAATDALDQAETALANERSTLATAAATAEHYLALHQEQLDRVVERDDRITALETELAQLQRDNQDLQGSQASLESAVQTLTAQNNVFSERNQTLIEENQRLTASELKLRTENVELVDRVEELSARVVEFSEQLRQKIEELAAIRQENEGLYRASGLGRATGGGLTTGVQPAARAAAPAPTREIRGAVTDVKLAEGLVSIDVGSTAGVAPGMLMVVLRGDEYVGDLIMTDAVDPTEAVGRIKPGGTKQVRPHDVVIDEASFMDRSSIPMAAE